MKRWWEKWPDRLEYELSALKDADIPCRRNENAYEEGRLELDLTPTIGGEKIDLVAKFPDLYPYFRFEIIAPNLDLPHHQNPFGKNLCLIGRDTANWSVHDTLAQFITERLPDVLKAGRADNNEDLQEVEIPQGEPFTDYYQYAPGAILVDSSWLMLIRLFQQTPSGSIWACRAQRFRKPCASSNRCSRQKRLAKGIWPNAAGRTASFARGAGTGALTKS